MLRIRLEEDGCRTSGYCSTNLIYPHAVKYIHSLEPDLSDATQYIQRAHLTIKLQLRRACQPQLLLLRPFLFPLTEPITKKFQVGPHEEGVLYKLLHAIHQSVSVTTGNKPLISPLTVSGELCVRFRDRRLIRNSEHAHPPAEKTQRVDGIERLRATTHLRNGEGPALRWTHTPGSQWDPVDLIFEDGGLWMVSNYISCIRGCGRRRNAHKIPMLFGGYPNMPVAPFAEFSELLDLRMIVLGIILHR